MPEFIVSDSGLDSYVSLGRTKQGRLFRKPILHLNRPFTHPADPKVKVTITPEMADKMIANFEANVCDIVQVPLTNEANQHTESPDANIGEVIGVERDDNAVYAMIDARDDKAADRLGKTLLGASAFLNLDYLDTRSGDRVGPTLLHVAVTNRPHVTELGDFEEIIAASAEHDGEPVLLTAPEETMTLDEMLATLKKDHGIDVKALQATAATGSGNVDLSAHPDLVGVLKLSNPTVSGDQLLESVVELAAGYKRMETTVGALTKVNAEAEVDGLVRQGRVLPAQREVMVDLRLSSPDTFAKLVPEAPIVKVGAEKGTTDADDLTLDLSGKQPTQVVDDIVSRHPDLFASSGKGK